VLRRTILKGDHQRIILAKLESNWPSSLRGKKLKFHPTFLFLATVAMLVGYLVSSKIVSDSLDLQPTWSLLLKIKKGDEI
jgi:hypothetical protein